MNRVAVVYQPKPAENHEIVVTPADVNEPWRVDDLLRSLPARHRESSWSPPPAEVAAPFADRRPSRALMPGKSASPLLVLRDEAIEVVGPILAPHGELLPLAGVNARLVVFAAPLIVDALLEDESDLRRFGASEPPVGFLERGVFDSAVVGPRQAFSVRAFRSFYLCLREELVRQLELTEVTSGTVFEPIGEVVSR